MSASGHAARYAGVVTLSMAFWAAASWALKTPEPWDAPAYPWWCLAAIALSGVAGWIFDNKPWAWGVLVMFGQLPVIAVQSGVGPLMLVGVGLLALLSIPASLASFAGFTARRRWRGGA